MLNLYFFINLIIFYIRKYNSNIDISNNLNVPNSSTFVSTIYLKSIVNLNIKIEVQI